MLQTRQKYAGGLSPGKYFLRSMQQNLPKRHLYTLVKTGSYINRIRSVGRGDYEHFCATLGLLYEEDNPNELIDLCELHNACFIPLTIYLYQSPKSGNLYVNRLMKYSSANFQDEMDMMQFVWAYEHYCNQEHGSFDFCEC